MSLANQAMHQPEAGVQDPAKCLVVDVDDTFENVEGTKCVGYIRSLHFRELVPITPQMLAVNHTPAGQEELPGYQ
jgi:hypothetical protein